jgi:hypothetical protein
MFPFLVPYFTFTFFWLLTIVVFGVRSACGGDTKESNKEKIKKKINAPLFFSARLFSRP